VSVAEMGDVRAGASAKISMEKAKAKPASHLVVLVVVV